MDLFAHATAKQIAAALQEEGYQESVAVLQEQLSEPPDPAWGDYAFPCFPLARVLRRSPQQIATALAERLAVPLAEDPLLREAHAQGGYLNVHVDPLALARHSIPPILEGSYFLCARHAHAPRVMVEYSQPNTHKVFHIGHMRNVALGDSLVRILGYLGHETIAANYIGDAGVHIARCLWYLRRQQAETSSQEASPEKSGLQEIPSAEAGPHARGEWLGALYVAATELLERMEGAERARTDVEIGALLRDLEAGEEQLQALWQETRQWSLDSFAEIYEWLGAHFDVVFYESEMDAAGREIVDAGLQKGVFAHSQGAVGVDLERVNGEKLGFLLVLKADGNTLYATKDLALGQLKFDRFQIAESIYVVGAEQALYFRQIFKTLALLGFEQAQHCHHLAYGLVMLPEGRMRSRTGNTVTFSQLRTALEERIHARYLDAPSEVVSAEVLRENTRRIAVAAIRYGMVRQDPAHSIVFHLEHWLHSEGDTGVYLCYAYTRVQSLLRQAEQAHGWNQDAEADWRLLECPEEHALLRRLYGFNTVVRRAGERRRPNLLAQAMFQLAKEFSRAYAVLPVLRAENEALGQARLSLFAAVGCVLQRGLGLLGILPPERM